MLKQELLELFSIFTREDWNIIDNYKNIVFQPTQEEIEAQKVAELAYKQSVISSKLQEIGVTKPEVITKEFVIELLERINAKQYVGEDLSLWVDNQIILFGDLETAFNDLVFSRL